MVEVPCPASPLIPLVTSMEQPPLEGSIGPCSTKVRPRFGRKETTVRASRPLPPGYGMVIGISGQVPTVPSGGKWRLMFSYNRDLLALVLATTFESWNGCRSPLPGMTAN